LLVTLDFNENKLMTIITNDGGAFHKYDIPSQVKSGHLGLAGMQERAKLFGGTFNITATEDKRTQLIFSIPFP
jgi:signal transduction histidine kinase